MSEMSREEAEGMAARLRTIQEKAHEHQRQLRRSILLFVEAGCPAALGYTSAEECLMTQIGAPSPEIAKAVLAHARAERGASN